jgi:hypothetical protein
VIFGFTIVAVDLSGREIGEKWEIRREWAAAHPDQMTTRAEDALYADGANLTLGPFIRGFQAFALYVAAFAILALVRIVPTRFRKRQDLTVS